MVSYATESGIIREFSDINVVSIKDGVAKLVQALMSIKNGVVYHEKREATTPILPGESRDTLFHRLNDSSNVIINSSGKLAGLKMAV